MQNLRDEIIKRRNDNFFGFNVNQGLEFLKSTGKNEFGEALEVYKRALEYLEIWFDYKSSPFKLFSSVNLKNKLPKLLIS